MADDPIITIDDIRATGHCTRGARQWFTANRLDFGAFLKQGLPASELLKTGDSLAQQVVDARLKRDQEHG